MGWPNCRFVLKALVSRIRHGGVMDDASPIVVNGKAHLVDFARQQLLAPYIFMRQERRAPKANELVRCKT